RYPARWCTPKQACRTKAPFRIHECPPSVHGPWEYAVAPAVLFGFFTASSTGRWKPRSGRAKPMLVFRKAVKQNAKLRLGFGLLANGLQREWPTGCSRTYVVVGETLQAVGHQPSKQILELLSSRSAYAACASENFRRARVA